MIKKRRNSKTQKSRSISAKLNTSIVIILVPLLAVLTIVSCGVAVRSIKSLSDKILNTQSDYAVSIVDDFFSSKEAAVSMFETNEELQEYFRSISTPQDIEAYPGKEELTVHLSEILEKMAGENAQEAWLADDRTDRFLLSTGRIVSSSLKDLPWYETVLSSKAAAISEPYQDPATDHSIISIVAPVFDAQTDHVIGFIGLDVFLDSLADSLSQIHVGENGYLELISNSSDYIYSNDPTATGKNVTELDISEQYKTNVLNKNTGSMEFEYEGIDYVSMSRVSRTTGWLAIATLPVSEVNAPRNRLITVLAVVSILIIALLIFVILKTVRRLVKPLADISADMHSFSEGRLSIDIDIHGNDEIGLLADSIRSSTHTLREMILDLAHVLKEISDGNLNVDVTGHYTGDFAAIREALEQILLSLNNALGQINIAADQVSSGAEQVSTSAQELSLGASEQAGSVEELAVTVSEISRHVSQNARNALEASRDAGAVKNEADAGNQQMQELLAAMENIVSSSRKIRKILKTIEEIAFQTNILSLNASVEAARAGAAGKGFAVVAEEIRSLAAKSAQASTNTNTLINDSLTAAEAGSKIAAETAQAMQKVMEGVDKVAASITSISSASQDQSDSIRQVTSGINQISDIIQTNSATAEESAAASEELSAQAQLLKELAGRFSLRELE